MVCDDKRSKLVIVLTMLFLLSSILFKTIITHSKDLKTNINNSNTLNLDYEYINTKDVAAINTEINTTIKLSTSKNVNEIEFDAIEYTDVKPLVVEEVKKEEPRQIWYLPTVNGRITQNPHYGHAAHDITSHNGIYENIFPVANGVISSIYRDNAGALIVTILHDIDGRKYTSLYAHLSSYAPGIYVGKVVTINDCIGKMGSTGISTGVHLHLMVVDCALYDKNDYNCRDLNGFFRYANTRASQGYLGLGSMMWVPGQWYSR